MVSTIGLVKSNETLQSEIFPAHCLANNITSFRFSDIKTHDLLKDRLVILVDAAAVCDEEMQVMTQLSCSPTQEGVMKE